MIVQHEVASPGGLETGRYRMRWMKLLLLIALLPYSCQRSADDPSAPKPQVTDGSTVAHFPISRDGDLILIPVRIGENEYPFVLDTGSEITVFDRQLRHHLTVPKESIQARTPNGLVTVEVFETPSAYVGSFSLPKSGIVVCTDLSNARRACGYNVAGLLGMDFLSDFVVHIDFDRGQASISLPSEKAFSGARVPISMRGRGTPTIELSLGTIGAAKDQFIVDTGGGMSATMTGQQFNRALGQGESVLVSEGHVMTASGMTRRPKARLASLTAGPFEVNDVVVGKATENAVGLHFLSRFILTMDFPHNVMYLEKSHRFAEVDHYDGSGLHLLRIDGKTVVKFVDPDSSADRNDIETDDVILSVNGRNAHDITMLDIRRLLSAAAGQTSMRIDRHGVERTVRLQLTTLR
jgi:hypothetical protein